jgi:hypothetical protein
VLSGRELWECLASDQAKLFNIMGGSRRRKLDARVAEGTLNSQWVTREQTMIGLLTELLKTDPFQENSYQIVKPRINLPFEF